MTQLPLSQLKQRRIEAEMLVNAYEVLERHFGEDSALAIVGETVEQAGRKAGKDFAASAPNGPSLEHFSSVFEFWGANNALGIDRQEISGSVMVMDITRCEYIRMYIEEMGLSQKLAYTLSCRRDMAFTKGYSEHLQLARETTLAAGGSMCPFRFVWTEDRTCRVPEEVD